MRLLEFARNKAYWILDFLGGGAVKAHLKTITRCNDCSMSEVEIEQYQNLHIKKNSETLPENSSLLQRYG